MDGKSDGTRPKSETVLEEATRVVEGDRAEAYGDALEDASRFATIASAVTGLSIKPHHFPLILIAVKMSRVANSRWHRDSMVDIAGYVRVAEKIFDRECELDDQSDTMKAIKETLKFP